MESFFKSRREPVHQGFLKEHQGQKYHANQKQGNQQLSGRLNHLFGRTMAVELRILERGGFGRRKFAGVQISCVQEARGRVDSRRV